MYDVQFDADSQLYYITLDGEQWSDGYNYRSEAIQELRWHDPVAANRLEQS